MKNISYKLFIYLFPILMVDYLLIMLGYNFNTFIVLPIFFIIAIIAIKIAVKYANNGIIKIINLFFIYALFSAFFYLANDAPFSCYTETIRSFAFPILFFYIGCNYSNDQSFDKWYVYACGFCFLVGFYLYLSAPDYYVSFMAEMRDNAFNASEYVNESNIMEYARFSSFFSTSYAISCLSIPSLVLSLSFATQSNTRREKTCYYLLALSSFLAAILCMQRIAMASAILIVLFLFFYYQKRNQVVGLSKIVLFALLLVIAGGLLINIITDAEWFDRVSYLVGDRFENMSFKKAMSIRTEQYTSFDRMTGLSFFTGLGLGSCGHAAYAHGLKSISDGEFFKLFYEFGIIGCSLLGMIIIPTIKRGIKYFKYYYAETIIILFYLAAGLGSDSLTFFIFSIMFWYSLGRIWNREYFKRLKDDGLYGYSKEQ